MRKPHVLLLAPLFAMMLSGPTASAAEPVRMQQRPHAGLLPGTEGWIDVDVRAAAWGGYGTAAYSMETTATDHVVLDVQCGAGLQKVLFSRYGYCHLPQGSGRYAHEALTMSVKLRNEGRSGQRHVMPHGLWAGVGVQDWEYPLHLTSL